MRNQGKITNWNDDKGYGFIQPDIGAEKVFVHIRAFGKHLERPALNEKVSYCLINRQARQTLCVKVTRAGAGKLTS